MTNKFIYYVYAYVRSKDSDTAKAGTPYYIGKGKGNRAFSSNHGKTPIPTNRSHIVFLETSLSELGALALERKMISWWGRKDDGSGVLLNRTSGGDGVAGYTFTDDHRKKMSVAQTGRRHTSESIQKMCDVQKGRTFSEEARKKMSKTRIENTNRVDRTIRKFVHTETEEVFIGTKYDLCLNFSLNGKVVSKIITKERHIAYGWSLLESN